MSIVFLIFLKYFSIILQSSIFLLTLSGCRDRISTSDVQSVVNSLPYKGAFYRMHNEYSPDLLNLIDEDGKEHEFEILDAIENDEGRFYALQPIYSDPKEQADAQGSYYIFEAVEEDGEQQFEEVEDEALLKDLSAEFESHFDDFYGSDDGSGK